MDARTHTANTILLKMSRTKHKSAYLCVYVCMFVSSYVMG